MVETSLTEIVLTEKHLMESVSWRYSKSVGEKFDAEKYDVEKFHGDKCQTDAFDR